jgi:hypothetical protein
VAANLNARIMTGYSRKSIVHQGRLDPEVAAAKADHPSDARKKGERAFE